MRLSAVLFSALSVSIALFASLAAASAATCPHASLATTDGKTYVAEFADSKPYSGRVDATFYTASASYAANDVALSIPPSREAASHSKSVIFVSPASEPLQGVELTFGSADSATACVEKEPIAVPSARASAAAKMTAAADAAPVVLAYLGSEDRLACPQPYVSARIHGTPAPLQFPNASMIPDGIRQALISLDIAPDGSVTRATVSHPSGYYALDRAALQAASQTRYDPAVFRCEPIAGTFVFSAELSSNSRHN
ncbi:MAG: TonB family protein [Candidatus Eremiobacteraeota bacterium]|nr:TonB family protein [Candidatus Eremiobacteraeota bacterium]